MLRFEEVMRTFYALHCLAATIWATAGHAASDAEILSLVDALRPTAEAITIDGDLSDWGALPFFADPAGDAGPDPGLDEKKSPGDDHLTSAGDRVLLTPLYGL